MEDIRYDIRWTNALDEKFISDFLSVQQEVFHVGTREEFRVQYEENIYGASVIVVVYLDEKPVAARGLWRNDIDGREAYQPGSTCVLPVCRGKGIFKEMTLRSIALLPSDAIIYNFPNNNSFPGYMKMGWKLVHDYGRRLLVCVGTYLKEHPIPIDEAYGNWWVVGRDYLHTKKGGHYFIVRKDSKKFCYFIVAEAEKSIALQFPEVKWGIFFYRSDTPSWFCKRYQKLHVVSRTADVPYIPIWKIDALCKRLDSANPKNIS